MLFLLVPGCSYVILRFEFSEDALTAMEELTNILPSNVNIKVRQLGQTHSKFSFIPALRLFFISLLAAGDQLLCLSVCGRYPLFCTFHNEICRERYYNGPYSLIITSFSSVVNLDNIGFFAILLNNFVNFCYTL